MAGIEREVTFRFLAEPGDVNFGGKVHGGAVMRWIDQAGYACASAWSGRYCVTVYVGGIQFQRPISIGQLVEVRARIIKTGSSSMHVAVDVQARDVTGDRYERTTHCLMVFVAVDSERQPVAVPTFVAETASERHLQDYAERIMVMRQEIEAERQRMLAELA